MIPKVFTYFLSLSLPVSHFLTFSPHWLQSSIISLLLSTRPLRKVHVFFFYSNVQRTFSPKHANMKLSLLLAAAFVAVASAGAPSGKYHGSKSILGQNVDVSLTVDDSTHADLAISGPISLTCAKEAYAYDGTSKITLTNSGKSGDCVHDALSQYSASINSISYDSGKDTITVDVSASIIKISITLTKSGQMEVSYAFLGASPSGKYHGSKSILGQNVDVSLTVDDSTHADLAISGPISLTCAKEAYAYDGTSKITLTNSGKSGDCVHDALSQYSASINSISYDSGKDTITVDVSASIIKISITLTKSGQMEVSYAFLGASPSGKYHGSKSILGQNVDVSLTVDDSTHADLAISGPISLTCAKEAYAYDGTSKITLTNSGKSGDCVHDALSQYSASINSISYDSGKDTITVNVSASIIKVSIELSKTGVMVIKNVQFTNKSGLRGSIM